jgi:NAD(P)-dependent dehydrogenase (short-subunit alcohol dehydrogenase family)
METKTIVITGSTRGIGYGLAESFLKLGCAVTVSGRARDSLEKACADLTSQYGPDQVFGCPCDVTDLGHVQALWEATRARFGRVDIWINNAGLGHGQANFWTVPPELIDVVVSTNLVGAMYASRTALRGMLEQGFGSLYNMEGMGSDGRVAMKGFTLYGATKAGLHFLTKSLSQEVEGTPLLVGSVRPGMVVTDMVIQQYEDSPEEWEHARRILNIVADRVETVTPWLAEQILANRKNGAVISWTSRRKIMGRFLMAPFRKRDVFGDNETGK